MSPAVHAVVQPPLPPSRPSLPSEASTRYHPTVHGVLVIAGALQSSKVRRSHLLELLGASDE